MVARLLLVALVPMVALVQVGWSDVRSEQASVGAGERLVDLVAFEQRVAAVAAPAFVEYLSHLGLATIDATGLDRTLAAELTGLDYMSIYLGNTVSLDQALHALIDADGELWIADGRQLGDELRRIEDGLVRLRTETNSANGDVPEISRLFADLDDVLDLAIGTARSVYDQVTIPVSLKRYRAESIGLGWVLETGGAAARAVMLTITSAGADADRIALAVAAHDQSVEQFVDLLPPEDRDAFTAVVASAPRAGTALPATGPSSTGIDLEWAQASADLVLSELTYLRTLGSWVDAYYDGVTVKLDAVVDESHRTLERTVWLLCGIVVVALVLVLLTARSILRPLLRLGRRAAQIGAGELALAPLPVRGPSVLRSVTRTVNAMHATLRQVDRQAAALAEGRLDDPSLAEASPGRLGVSIRSSVERLAQMTAQLQASEERSTAIVSYATVAIWTVDDDGRIVSANSAAAGLLAVSEVDQLGCRLDGWVAFVPGECEVQRPDGSHVWLDIDITDVQTSGGRLRTVIGEDITERKEFERRLAHQARTDALTGLPNRFAVLERLAQLSDGDENASVLFIDVDGFKSVNDTKGHGVGDLVLIEIARRLQREVRAGGMVARLGGDEFVVVVTDLPDEHAVVRLGRRLIERVEQPYDIDDSLFALSASVGVATMLPGDLPLDVIHRADSAVYHAKDLGRARVEVFDQEFQARVEQRAEMEFAMREAIARGDLQMYLQPVFDLANGRPVGAEALARWHRAGIGFVSPTEFVSIAENSSLIVDLTRSMLLQACERLAAWKRLDPECTMRIAVNLSGRHLIEGDLIGDLVEMLSVTGADPRLLELELTETQLLADLEPAREVLETVRAMGVTVAVDDFGTGFSSMAYLRQLQVDVIKVDRSFVAGAGTDGFDATAIDAMVNFGRVLGVHVVAEGVETEAQLAFVRSKGCTRAQGFLLGMPLPPEDTERVLFGVAPTVALHGGIER